MIIKKSNLKLFVIVTICLFCFFSIFIPSVEAASKFSFAKLLIKKNKRHLTKIAKNLDDTNLHRAVPSASTLSKKLDIPERMLSSPALRKLVTVGEKIQNQGEFASRMLNKSAMPEEVIRQYSRFGKQEYLGMAKSISNTLVTENKSKILKGLNALKGKYRGLNTAINNFNAGKYDNDILVRTIKKTGKRGAEVLGWLSKHPKLALSSAAATWYLYDPESFEDALEKSGKKLGEFVGTTMINVSAGVGEGVRIGFVEKWKMHSTGPLITGAILIVATFLFIFTKTFRRLLLFPFHILGLKLNKKMDAAEERSHRTRRSSNHQQTINRQENPSRTIQSNL